MLKENPARLVPTPKLPKRIPSVLSRRRDEWFLNQLAAPERDVDAKLLPRAAGETRPAKRNFSGEEGLLLKRDRALLELLYAAGLRVSELTGLNLVDMDRHEKMLRVRGKGDKERIVPTAARRKKRWKHIAGTRTTLVAIRARQERRGPAHSEAIFLNYAGRRLTQRSVGRIVKNMYGSPT